MRYKTLDKNSLNYLFRIASFIIGVLIIIYFGFRNMNLAISNPQFTSAEILGVKGHAQSDYIVFKYKVDGQIYQGEQSAFLSKISSKKGQKYLLVYNKERYKKRYLLIVIVYHKKRVRKISTFVKILN